jgi:methylenetetrahydrofolate dehydrogenase (NADP+)/methenyltetrahydrofolate cyclohydrolase
MTLVFDGRKFAEKKISELDKKVALLKNQGIHPKLASILVGEDPASKLYVSLKKKKAEGIGAEMDIYFLKEKENIETILALIDSLNSDLTVYGIMVQLPLPASFTKKDKEEIINSIKKEKDVDGLREDSPFLHPTAKAVIDVIKESRKEIDYGSCPIVCVVGSGGMVGKPLVKELKAGRYEVIECGRDTKGLKEKTSKADILISATGIPGLITFGMIKKGATVIDVGSPKGDVNSEASKVAGFLTPVPGGIGPITIASLLENLVKASSKTLLS